MSVSEWTVGGKISYKGEWEGKTYEDKGQILELVPGQKLVSSYWSAMSGLADISENYQQVSYELFPEGTATRLVISQTESASAEAAEHSEGNWNTVLEDMKKILEA